MKLTYIWHDCFVFENNQLIIVFDFWKDMTSRDDKSPSFIEMADKAKPIYVIVSHHHKDHFTNRIFDWDSQFNHIHYILSKDVARHVRHLLNPDSLCKGIKPDPSHITVLQPGESFSDSRLRVEAFGSTDIGNSYCVTIGGLTLFHAGDLNAWIWKDESTEEEVNDAIADYNRILTSIAAAHPVIDYAMFLVDSRIGTDYFTGARMFVRAIDVRRFFPMHFGLGDSLEQQTKYRIDAASIDLYANPARGEYICLQAPYSSFSEPEK